MLCFKNSALIPYYSVAFRGVTRRHKVHFAVTYQITATHFFQGVPQEGPVFRIVVAQKGLVKFSLLQFPYHR